MFFGIRKPLNVVKKPYVEMGEIGESTPEELATPLEKLWLCLLDTSEKLPPKEYGIFTLIEDCGVRRLSYSNHGGGRFDDGRYRSFRVKYDEIEKIVSVGLTQFCTETQPDWLRTYISVIIEFNNTVHASLQLNADSDVKIFLNNMTVYHNGRISIGTIGSGKKAELKMFVENKYPEIIDEKKFNLGTLCFDDNWTIKTKEIEKLIENLISYGLIRDDYREFKKRNFSK